MRRSARWAVLISGRGSTMRALLDLQSQLDVRLVISSNKTAPGIKKAMNCGVPVIEHTGKVDFAKLHQDLTERRIDHVFLLGFMKLLPAEFCEKWKKRIFNVHPSLLPDFPGLQAMEKSFQERKKMGVTIHHVIPEMDSGKIIKQEQVVGTEELTNFSDAQLRMSFLEQKLVRYVGEKLQMVVT